MSRTTTHPPPEPCPEGVPAEHPDWEALAPRGFYPRYGRRFLDLALIAIALPLAAVPGLVIALVNWASFRRFDEIFYTQERVGYRGESFRIYKFRTMREAPGGEMESWSTGGDPERVTRFGRFLRSSHLDELPQLLNIIQGDMSFIGPRPEMVEIERWACENVEGFARRLAIRPGITGFAQIMQGYTPRNARAYRRKLGLCLCYVRSMTFLTDVWIIALTVVWMLRGKGWQWRADENPLTRAAFRRLQESPLEDLDSIRAPLPSESVGVEARESA